MKKILFMIGSLEPGGAEKVLTHVVKHLNKEVFEITVQTVYDTGVYIEEVKQYAKYKTIYKTKATTVEEAQKIKEYHQYLLSLSATDFSREVIDEEYDIEVAFLEDEATRIIANSPNKFSRKIAWVHTDFIQNKQAGYFYPTIEQQKACYKNFEDIVFVSQAVKEAFMKRYHLLNQRNFHVFYNPINRETILKKAQAPIEMTSKFKMISVGRLVPVKGFERLLHVHRRLIEEGFDYELMIVGEGELRPEFETFIQENDLGSHTKLLGYKDNPYPYMLEAELFVSTSLFEGLSTVVAEALVLGVPIVATDCAGTNELLGDSEYGLVVAQDEVCIYEGIKRLLTNTIEYDHYKQMSRRRGEQFKLEETIEKLEFFLLEEKSKKYAVTVFTPTYNRAHTLSRTYESLKKQTVKNFEWIIVDDGSTDDTMNLVSSWLEEETEFEIVYLNVKNGGKHRAINKGTEVARGELFFMVDSDDFIVPKAIEKLMEWEATLSEDERRQFAGISGNKGYSETDLVGDSFAGAYVDATSLERGKYRIKGDKAEVFYTDLLRQYKFPEFEGENFLTEFVVWFQIAHDGHPIRWFNEIIYVCEYLDDGLTRNLSEVTVKNPRGHRLANELYQQLYGGFLKREKEILMKEVPTASREEVTTLFDRMDPELKRDLEVTMVFVNAYGRFGQVDVMEELLEMATFYHSKLAQVYGLLAEVSRDREAKVAALQKACLYSDDESFQLQLSRYVAKENWLSTAINQLRTLYEKKDIEACTSLIASHPGIDVWYKLELQAVEQNAYLKEFLICLLVGKVEGYPLHPAHESYIYGHAFYECQHLLQSKDYLSQVSSQAMTPLTTYRLWKLLEADEQFQEATTYEKKYRAFAKEVTCENL